MKKIYALAIALLLINLDIAFAQPANDNCSGAITLTPYSGQTCGSQMSATVTTATQSLAGIVCNGSGNVTDADDDTWYKFVATSNAHTIHVTGTSSGYYPYIDLRNGTNCSTGNIACGYNNTRTPLESSCSYSSFQIGLTYWIRVYGNGTYQSGGGSGSFKICITTNPANDECSGAIPLTVYGPTCGAATTGDVASTSQSLPSVTCTSTGGGYYADDDVWYKFVATQTTHTITVNGSSGFDAVINLHDGNCVNGFTLIACQDAAGVGAQEVMVATGLTVGTTYFVRVFDTDQYIPPTTTFDICVTGAATASPPVADFSASATTIAAGGSTNFTDLSTNTPTSWLWTFTGGTPATSTVKNPTGITYPTAGCYQVSLKATNASGNNTKTKTCYINVTAATGSYCAITSSVYGTTASDYIDGVTLGTINNINTGSTTGPFYNDYTAMSTNLTKSSTYTVNIKAGAWPATYPDYYAVWIDYNHDYDFADAGEKLGEFLSTTPSATQSISFTVPSTATTGSTRMRVRGVWVTTAGIDPCLSYDYGETEDYSVNIVTAGSAPVANFSASATTISPGGSVNFTDLSTNTPTSWLWTFTGGIPSTSTVQNPTGITYATAGCYQVSLKATNASGNNTKTQTCYINVTSGGATACDTLYNYHTTDNITLYTNTAGGYVAGHNSYGDLAKAEIFSTYTAGYKIDGAYFAFARAKYATTAKTISVKVWDNDGAAGVPNTVLATKNVTIASIAPDVTAGQMTHIQFASPVSVTGTFYLGIEFTYASGDTVALFSNTNGETNPGTAWEKFSDGSWHAMSETASWGSNISLLINPVMCSPTLALTEDVYVPTDFNIYPNPNAGEFTLEIYSLQNTPATYTIFNAVGTAIAKKELKGISGTYSEKINLGEYANGIYFIQITTDKRITAKKIIKQ